MKTYVRFWLQALVVVLLQPLGSEGLGLVKWELPCRTAGTALFGRIRNQHSR